MCVCMHVRARVCVRACARACVRACVCVCKSLVGISHVGTCAIWQKEHPGKERQIKHTHTPVHMHAHTHTHTYTQPHLGDGNVRCGCGPHKLLVYGRAMRSRVTVVITGRITSVSTVRYPQVTLCVSVCCCGVGPKHMWQQLLARVAKGLAE